MKTNNPLHTTRALIPHAVVLSPKDMEGERVQSVIVATACMIIACLTLHLSRMLNLFVKMN
jgi:hypothetical protein